MAATGPGDRRRFRTRLRHALLGERDGPEAKESLRYGDAVAEGVRGGLGGLCKVILRPDETSGRLFQASFMLQLPIALAIAGAYLAAGHPVGAMAVVPALLLLCVCSAACCESLLARIYFASDPSADRPSARDDVLGRVIARPLWRAVYVLTLGIVPVYAICACLVFVAALTG